MGGTCVAGGHAWQAGGMHGRGHVCWGGMHDRGCVWQGGMHGGGPVWQGACVAGGGHAWQERRPLQRAVRILLECILVGALWEILDPPLYHHPLQPSLLTENQKKSLPLQRIWENPLPLLPQQVQLICSETIEETFQG